VNRRGGRRTRRPRSASAAHPERKRGRSGKAVQGATGAAEASVEAPGSSRQNAQEAESADVSTSAVIGFGDFSLHDLFAQQARRLLDRADIDDEQKENIMLAMSCPCCGAGGPSFTVKLKK
jgi:hypothetical protein